MNRANTRIARAATLVVCLTVALAAFASDRSSIERTLRNTYKGKVVNLRRFFREDKLRYGSDGLLVGAATPGSWTTHAKIEIKDLHLRADRLEITARRISLGYDLKSKRFEQVRRDESVWIEVALPKGEASFESIQRLLARVFIPTDDELFRSLPAHWRTFLLGSSLSAPPADPQQPTAETIPKLRSGIEAPKCVFCPNPGFTREARLERVNDFAIFDLTINAEGRVVGVQIVRPLGYGLEDSAIDLLYTWRFRPAHRQGQPIAVQIPVEVTFKIF